MDVTDLIPQLDKLDTDIDDLEDVLKPLLKLGEVSSRLPLLDKAKLLVLSSYAIESMLFCMTLLPPITISPSIKADRPFHSGTAP